MPFVECCLHLLACNIHADLYGKASFVAFAMGNLRQEFVLHATHCVPEPSRPAFG